MKLTVKEEMVIKKKIHLELDEKEAKIIMILLGRTRTEAQWSKGILSMFSQLYNIFGNTYNISSYIPNVIECVDPPEDLLNLMD